MHGNLGNASQGSKHVRIGPPPRGALPAQGVKRQQAQESMRDTQLLEYDSNCALDTCSRADVAQLEVHCGC